MLKKKISCGAVAFNLIVYRLNILECSGGVMKELEALVQIQNPLPGVSHIGNLGLGFKIYIVR